MKKIKGIILAGGLGSRLFPLTIGTSKQLLPVYDKPMIYYPLSVFLKADIKDILIITTNEDTKKYKKLLGNGQSLGIKISYETQDYPNGIAESFIIGSKFIGNDNVSLILGDNIFHGDNLEIYLAKAKKQLNQGFSTIFGVTSENPENFGVVEFDKFDNVSKIVEKPEIPKSNTVVSGLYFYTNDVIHVAESLKPSSRGEMEITDINNFYLSENKLKLNLLDDDIAWIDTGTYSSLIKASKYFEEYEKMSQQKSSCIEEIAYRRGFIDKLQLIKIAESMKSSDYGKYLKSIK